MKLFDIQSIHPSGKLSQVFRHELKINEDIANYILDEKNNDECLTKIRYLLVDLNDINRPKLNLLDYVKVLDIDYLELMLNIVEVSQPKYEDVGVKLLQEISLKVKNKFSDN